MMDWRKQKGLLLCFVSVKEGTEIAGDMKKDFHILDQLVVEEVVMRRWDPAKNRDERSKEKDRSKQFKRF